MSQKFQVLRDRSRTHANDFVCATHNLHNRCQFLKICLMLIKVGLTGNHMNNYMWMLLLSSSAAILKISIRLTQVIVVYAVKIIHCRCRRYYIDICGIFMDIVTARVININVIVRILRYWRRRLCRVRADAQIVEIIV